MARLPIEDQVSAGGVVLRRYRRKLQVVLISVGPSGRWQLPEGLVGRGEAPEAAARREAREEAGVESDLLGLIDTIQYQYITKQG